MKSRCANCGIVVRGQGNKELDAEIFELVQKWLAPKIVEKKDPLCKSCLHAITSSDGTDLPPRNVGHKHVCPSCGISVLGKRCRVLLQQKELYGDVVDAIMGIMIGQAFIHMVNETTSVCHACWQKAVRIVVNRQKDMTKKIVENNQEIEVKEEPNSDDNADTDDDVPSKRRKISNNIILPDYCRTSNCKNRCVIKGCKGQGLSYVKVETRKHVLIEYNYYLTPIARLCKNHKDYTTWDIAKKDDAENRTFNAFYIQDMLSLKELRFDL